MTLRKLAAIAPVAAALALAAPVATASASTTPDSPGSQIPCYPFPAFCGPNGQPWTPWPFPFQFPIALLTHIGSLPPLQAATTP